MKPPLRVPRPRRLGRPLRATLPRVRSAAGAGIAATIGSAGVPAGGRLLVVGDLVLDVVVARRGQIVAGSDAPGTVRFRLGGSAANTARAFVALGGAATFVGSVGADAAGRLLTAAMRRDGVTARTVTHGAATARLVALLGPGGERSFITERGAADLLEPSDLQGAWFRGVGAVHLPLYSLINEPLSVAARRAVEMLRERAPAGVVSVDLSSAGPLRTFGARPTARILRALGPDLIFANAAEAEVFGVRLWAARLLELAPVLVIKQGRAGCEVLVRGVDGSGSEPGARITVATRPIQTTDTTGAGDAFDAGFLRSLLQSGVRPADATLSDLRRAAVAGNRAATTLLAAPRPELAW